MTKLKKIRDGFGMMLFKLERILLKDTLDPLMCGGKFGKFGENVPTEKFLEEMDISNDEALRSQIGKLEPFFEKAQKIYMVKDAYSIFKEDKDGKMLGEKETTLACMVIFGVRDE